MIVSIFNHMSEALMHLSTAAVHFSSLAKITNRETFHTILNAAVRPLVQLNVPEKFLNPVTDPVQLMTEEQRMVRVGKMILPRHNVACIRHELRIQPTCILAAAVWLKLKRKFFNQGTAKEACELFDARTKQLS